MDITGGKIFRFLTNPRYAWMVARTNLERRKARVAKERGYASLPDGVVVFLTDRCNLRCPFCAQWGEKGIRKEQPPSIMDRDMLDGLVDELAEWRPSVILMGGEPLLHHSWKWAVERIKAAGMHCTLITNGSLLEPNAIDLVEAGPDVISVSLDGPREVHDRVRGEGVFDRVTEGIRGVDRARKKKGSVLPRIVVGSTVSEDTYRTLPELAEYLRDLPIDRLTIQHLYFVTEDQIEAHSHQVGRLFGIESSTIDGVPRHPGDVDVEILEEIMDRMADQDYPFEFGFLPDHPRETLRDYYGDLEGYVRTTPAKCGFIWHMITVYPDGGVSPCLNYPGGKLGAESFRDIWNGESMRRLRRTVEEHGYFPICHRCCNS